MKKYIFAVLLIGTLVVGLYAQQYNNLSGRSYFKQISLPGQTASITTTSIFTPTADGLYRVTVSLNCETAVATATVLATIGYSDISNTAQTVATAGAACTTLGASSITSFVSAIQVKSGVAMTYATTAANTPHYALRISVENLI